MDGPQPLRGRLSPYHCLLCRHATAITASQPQWNGSALSSPVMEPFYLHFFCCYQLYYYLSLWWEQDQLELVQSFSYFLCMLHLSMQCFSCMFTKRVQGSHATAPSEPWTEKRMRWKSSHLEVGKAGLVYCGDFTSKACSFCHWYCLLP